MCDVCSRDFSLISGTPVSPQTSSPWSGGLLRVLHGVCSLGGPRPRGGGAGVWCGTENEVGSSSVPLE